MFLYICIWTIVCNKEFIIIIIISNFKAEIGNTDLLSLFDLNSLADPNINYNLLSSTSLLIKLNSKHIPRN